MALDSQRNTNSMAKGCAPALFGIVFILIAVVIVWNTLSFLPGTLSAQGTILSCSMGGHGACQPTVSFQTASGQPVTFQSSFGSSTFWPGESVPVRYRPTNPGDARIDSWEATWLLPSIMAVIGLVALLVSLSVFLGQGQRAQPKPPAPFSPDIHDPGQEYQLGSLEAVYRINVRAKIIGLIVWNLSVLLIGGVFVAFAGEALFFNGQFQLSSVSSLGCFSCSLPIPLLMLSVGVMGLVITVRQRHTCLYIYTQGLLLLKRRASPVRVVPWPQISYVRRYTSGKKGSTHYHYHITCSNGQHLIFSDEYIDYQELFAHIDLALVRVHLPDLFQRYQQGESVSFGPYLSVNRDGILHFRSLHVYANSYSWSEIDSIQFNDSTMELFLNSQSKPIVLTFMMIDNACLLRALVERVRGQ